MSILDRGVGYIVWLHVTFTFNTSGVTSPLPPSLSLSHFRLFNGNGNWSGILSLVIELDPQLFSECLVFHVCVLEIKCDVDKLTLVQDV